jgi:hypothetical protein
MHDRIGFALNANIDPLDELLIRARMVCVPELRIGMPREYKHFRLYVHMAAVHADPDEVLLRRFQALLAYMDMTTWRHFRIDEGQLRLAHNAEPLVDQNVLHCPPPPKTALSNSGVLAED